MSKQAMKLALEALKQIDEAMPFPVAKLAQSALREALANEALERMAENAREFGLDYDTSAGTQVSKVWWDGEKLMALAEQQDLSEAYRAELDKISQRNYELRMENAQLRAQPEQEHLAWNKNIRDSVDSLLEQAGFEPDSSARNALSCMNFDKFPPA